ncbi:ABC transporter permease [Companilactobacillus mishanensis]|uniref:ABC transporter permease n=1 Tax=Companilactobacillus mishanensis TaxID=2486008 RepID=UPI001297ACA6|nr:ABC transporter permease [Companilactobacillus mishanensis]MQS90168.1 ABC transporter permease [Companilactobacillus mishanensis]
MKSFLYQTDLNFKRIVMRNKKFFIFDLLLPIIFYLLYTKVLSTGIPKSLMSSWNANYLVSMMVFSCLLGSIITVSNTLLEDHTSHFDLFVDISPLSKIKYYASLIVVFLTLNLISVITISLVGIFVNNVNLPLQKLTLVSINTLLGSLVLILVGILISLAKSPSTVNLLNSLAVFPVAMLSGLWWPLSTMPDWLQTIGKLLPPYAISQANISIMNSKIPSFSSVLNIVSWFTVLLVLNIILIKLPSHKELETE